MHGYTQMEIGDVISQNQMEEKEASEELKWLKASYRFHTYSYRDPRSAFAAAVGSPVVSPTTSSVQSGCRSTGWSDFLQSVPSIKAVSY
jgi:hypothetical protein